MPLVNPPLVEPMDMDQMDPVNANQQQPASPNNLGPNHQVMNPTLDLEQYCGNYKGMGKIQRLLYIADHCPPYRVEALNLVMQYIQDKTHNTVMYQTAFSKLITGGRGAPDLIPDIEERGRKEHGGSFDQAWLEATAKKAACKLEKLDTDLKHYKANSIKSVEESIRRGQDELGEHHLDCGDLQAALKCFSRSRDYCTSTRHILTMCFNVIKVSIYLRNWSLVLSYVSRAETSPEISASASGSAAGQPPGPKESPAVRDAFLAKLKVASGLAELANRKYKVAARHFLQVNFAGLDYSEIVSGSNIAAYGALCALATFEREELHKAVLGSSEFRQFLELEPWLLEVLRQFQESAYGECLNRLDQERDNLLLDIYLAPHVPSLLARIRSKAMVQYASVYLSADLNAMATAFNTEVEEEVMGLILEGQIAGRIDSHKKVLHSKDIDLRSNAFHQARAFGTAMEARANALILRAALQKAKVCVKAPAKGEDKSGGGGGGGGGGGPPSTPIPHSPSGPSSSQGSHALADELDTGVSGGGGSPVPPGPTATEPSLTPSNSSGHSSPTAP